MIIYNDINNKNVVNKKLSKEKLEERRIKLEKFNKEVKKQVKINQKRKILSINYSKNIISD